MSLDRLEAWGYLVINVDNTQERDMESAVGYIRVSTEEQAREGVSLEMQVAKIRQYCELNDLALSGIYGDPGVSGKHAANRPGLQAVLSLVAKKRIQHVVIYKLDRLARNTVETLQMVEALDKKGVGLHSISEKLDTQSSIGRFVVRTLASLAEMERDQISERTSAALSQKRSKGERTNYQAPFGFRHENGMLIQDANEQEILSNVATLKSEGHTVRAIVQFLAENGYTNRKGNPFGVSETWRMIKKAA